MTVFAGIGFAGGASVALLEPSEGSSVTGLACSTARAEPAVSVRSASCSSSVSTSSAPRARALPGRKRRNGALRDGVRAPAEKRCGVSRRSCGTWPRIGARRPPGMPPRSGASARPLAASMRPAT